jgi:hypothetical protein
MPETTPEETMDRHESATIPFVETTMAYIDPAYGPTVLYEYARTENTHHYDPHPARIHNAREATGLSLDRNGFTLIRHDTKVTNFRDADQVRRVYYAEIEKLVRELTGAVKVIPFGDVLRSDDADKHELVLPEGGIDPDRVFIDSARQGATVPPMQVHDTANNPHIDFNEKTLRRMAAPMLGDEAPKFAGKRVAMINLWRGLRTVERKPLAVCDASTVTDEDLVLGLIGTRPEDPGDFLEGFNVAYSPKHRWYYYPRMKPEELLVFKLCDSDGSKPQLTAHAAFDDPSSPPNAAPRQSIEIRTIVFFGD